MKIIVTVVSLLCSSLSLARDQRLDALLQEGHYQCPVSFLEFHDYEFKAGDDFPTVIHFLPQPRRREQVLTLAYQDGRITVIDAVASLPNYLFITDEEQYHQMSDFFSPSLFTIYWPASWYFGSKMDIELTRPQRDRFDAIITFDDNDGIFQTLPQVTCRKKSSLAGNNPSLF